VNPRDLIRLEQLLRLADRVVPMRDIYKGDTNPRVVGMRHDVDDNPGSFDTALRIAEWEFQHGYSSTFFLLHDSHYWNDDMLCRAPLFEEMGHEVGIHVNAIAEGLRQARGPHDLLGERLAELRSAVRVVGCVAHGDQLCYAATPQFVNDEMFTECRRPSYGEPDRIITYRNVRMRLIPAPLRMHMLEYDANWLPRGNYLSDSGGAWSQPISNVTVAFGEGQLHVLWHPDWWVDVFAAVPA